ncbi:phage tail tape measure protein [Rhodococcus spongiicola]|uniref:Phage tail tape measure protein domain-containing protein n=1 Tax=Rhodococcus spongiicola TaxID=2487352 RepID=A0A438B5G9_9NOCA|nr:phage tail tape measure protein [Rhodococcus spongiicola]RVW06222.1 hypothetical protein EF834_01840 [Rhodococcus spongiicola]
MKQAGKQAGKELGDGIADGLSQAEAAVKTASRKIEQARSAEQDAAAKLNIEELKLQELREKGNAKASQLASAEERVRKARQKHNQTVGAAEAALKQLETAQERATRATKETGDEARQSSRKLLDFSDSVDDASGQADIGVGKIGAFAAAVAGIGGAVGLGMQALDNLDIENRLGVQLGATPELAEQYGEMAGELYKSGMVGSMQEASDAILAVASTFEVAGSEGEKSISEIADSAAFFSRNFGVDMAETVQTANQLITQGLAKDSTEAFDLMTTAWQRTDEAMRGELPDLINEYGTFFSAAGLSGQEAFGTIANAADGGKVAMDKVGDAVKEFTIRATDLGDKGAVEAFDAMGLSARDMANKLLAGGQTSAQAFNQIIGKLQEVEDPARQAELSVALFGAPLEDLSKNTIPGFLDGMGSAGDAMNGFEGATGRFQEQWESNNPSLALDQLKNTITGGLTDALGSMATWVMDNSDSLKTLALVAAPFFAALVGYTATVKAIEIATLAWNVAHKLLDGTMKVSTVGLIVAAIAGLVTVVVLIATKTTWFQDIWSAVWGAITAAWDWAWGVLSSGFEMLKGAFGSIGDKVGEVKDWIVEKWDAVVGFVTGLPGRIADAASGMWDGIKDTFKSALNWVIRKWNDFEIEMKVPDYVPFLGGQGFTIPTPDLPLLAAGGVAGRRDDGTLWGPGTGTSDSILGVDRWGIPTAFVSTGEGVVRKSAMDRGGNEVVAALNAGWVPSPELLHAMVPGYAEGGVVGAADLAAFAKGVDGKPYVWGGVNWGDCSGAVSALANFAAGLDPFGSRFATGTQAEGLAERGFKSGVGPAGSLRIGWFNGGPFGGHTAATLPNGVNFEMGGERGNGQYGGTAAGASDPMFTDHAWLPMATVKMAESLQPSSGQTPPGTGAVGGAQQPQQTFSGRERFRQMGADIGGIWADSLIDITGVGGLLDLADRYTITPEAGTAPTGGQEGVDGDRNVVPWLMDARNFLSDVGLFDNGGIWEPGTFGFNGLNEPEHVLKDAHWKTAEANIAKVDELVGAGAGGPRVQIVNNNNQTIADQASWQRDQANRERIALMRFGR